mmetsp:Transcript_62459/g.103906  ORF Transcript_62459/g.103906 Transcript_62459/m.103906 type:complete len:323 (+) Transcript_62459:95-1063(+)|eukprot:CAMPEP_0119342062 /NCGR_PEP_ID=MMETSP1333-20130426/103930_1 /TAXON_ID=418940 /ORGANISM="Scyphosphaera apsteinii, Strain RCC1455" /LENGTH=322 /DNA_ID=CAMNT_0007354199 /DNA_START=111 /DNA_END=1079 /DNA_ORIENTATION=-
MQIAEEQLGACGGELLPESRGIRLRGWRFECNHGPIAGVAELHKLSERLAEAAGTVAGAPLPEAIFAQNWVQLSHEESGITLSFAAQGALTWWATESAKHGSAGLQVPVASRPAWREHVQQQLEGSRDFDWTFSTNYAGDCDYNAPRIPHARSRGKDPDGKHSGSSGSDGGSEQLLWLPHRGRGLDMTLLRRTDLPILCFVDLTLYSDDLRAFGESELRLRLRIMPQCFFILMRHWLRVDGVLIRQRDTRVFHKFGENRIIRAQRLSEAALPPLPPLMAPFPSGADELPPPPLAGTIPTEEQAAECLAALPPRMQLIEELQL